MYTYIHIPHEIFKIIKKDIYSIYIYIYLNFSSVSAGDDGDEPKQPSNNDVTQSKYFNLLFL